MRDMLPEKVNKYECGIVNLGSFDTNGTHWVCYYKNNKKIFYFDSYGNLIDRPVKELITYLGKNNIYYNDNQIQDYNDPPICGHLCVYVLKELNKNVDYKNILYKLILNKNEWKRYF